MNRTQTSREWLNRTFQIAITALAMLSLVACEGSSEDSNGAKESNSAHQYEDCISTDGSYDTSYNGKDGNYSAPDQMVYADASEWGDYSSSYDTYDDAYDPGSGNPWDPNAGQDGCIPNCEAKQCGPDGCGGTCGWCSAEASCQGGSCVKVPGCYPECAGMMIGEDDGCGGVCSGGGFGIGLKPGGAQDVGYFRSLVAQGQVPSSEFFPIEGFLNEHDTPLPAPNYEMLATLHAFVGMFYDPQTDEPLIAMQLGLNSGIDPATIDEKHFDLVIVVDVSGSMGESGKLEYVKEGLLLMLDSLDAEDTLTIVTYADVAKVALGTIAVSDENLDAITNAISALSAKGSTNIYAGLELGYQMAMQHITDSQAMHRVLFLSDGLATAGNESTSDIVNMSAMYTDEGIGITTLGVGSDFEFDLMYQLANQGNGNFYFLESADKLVQVFQHELEYLLTPVAENLKISFSLPEGFVVDEIYGFEFEIQDGEVVLLGPSPQETVGPVDTDPGQTGNGDGNVSVSTLFASKKNGILMVKVRTEQSDIFEAWTHLAAGAELEFATIRYSYDLVDEGDTESATTVIKVGSLSYFAEDGEGPLAWFTGPIMQRNFCILRTGLAIQEACDLFNQEVRNTTGAIQQLHDATVFCQGINLQLDDSALTDDIAFMQTLQDNICAIAQCASQ